MKIIQILFLLGIPIFSTAQMSGTYLTLKFGKPFLKNPSSYKVNGLTHSSTLNFGIGIENDYVFKGMKNLSLTYGGEILFNQFRTNWTTESYSAQTDLTWYGLYSNSVKSFDIQFPVGVNYYFNNLYFSGGITYTYHFHAKMNSKLRQWTSRNPTKTYEESPVEQKICNPWFTDCGGAPAWESPFELWTNGKIGYEYYSFRFEVMVGLNLTQASLDDFREEGMVINNLNDFTLISTDSGQAVGTNYYSLSIKTSYRFF